MKIEYDADANAAYIYLTDESRAGEVARTHAVSPNEIGGAMLNLDFDATGRLIGIEVLGARSVLPPQVLKDLA